MPEFFSDSIDIVGREQRSQNSFNSSVRQKRVTKIQENAKVRARIRMIKVDKGMMSLQACGIKIEKRPVLSSTSHLLPESGLEPGWALGPMLVVRDSKNV